MEAVEKKIDRRIRKTRKLLLDGLTELLKEKSMKDITVKELCDRVDINRGTFYLHYQDIYDMIAQLEDNMMNGFEQVFTIHTPAETAANPYTLIVDIFKLVKENAALSKSLLSDNGDISFLMKLKNLLHDKCFSDWASIQHFHHTERFEYFYSYMISGCTGLISQWLDGGCQETPEEMAELAELMIVRGISVIQ